ELLGALNEPHQSHRVGAIVPIPRARSRRLRQQATALVVPQGLSVDMRLGGNLTGSHSTSMNPVPEYRVNRCQSASELFSCWFRRQIYSRYGAYAIDFNKQHHPWSYAWASLDFHCAATDLARTVRPSLTSG